MTAWRTVPVTQRPGRSDPTYVAAVRECAERAVGGQGCWFHAYGMCKYNGAPFDWSQPRAALSFSAHHVERVMDGGASVVDASKLVPAHRGCNSADGLRAQNARRAAHKRGEAYVPAGPDLDEEAAIYALSGGLTPPHVPMADPTSRNW